MKHEVWQKIKDVLLLLFGVVLLILLLPLGAGGKLAGLLKRILDNGGGTDETGGHLDDAGENVEETGERIRAGSESVERSGQLGESAISDNRSAQDILREVRERGKGQKGG